MANRDIHSYDSALINEAKMFALDYISRGNRKCCFPQKIYIAAGLCLKFDNEVEKPVNFSGLILDLLFTEKMIAYRKIKGELSGLVLTRKGLIVKK